MGNFMTEEVFATEEGRKRAKRSLWIDDHGWLRKLYDNSHQIGEDMWRSYQPSPGRIKRWAQDGIKTIINLRGLRNNIEQPGFYWLEKEACAQHRITLLDIRAHSREAPRRSFLLDFDKALQTMAYPAMMHCKSGADRAGLGSTLYLFLKVGLPLDDALEQLSFRYGHVSAGKTGVLDHFFDVYREKADADGVPPSREHFMDWAANEYDPEAVTESHRENGLATFLTDKILRRE